MFGKNRPERKPCATQTQIFASLNELPEKSLLAAPATEVPLAKTPQHPHNGGTPSGLVHISVDIQEDN